MSAVGLGGTSITGMPPEGGRSTGRAPGAPPAALLLLVLLALGLGALADLAQELGVLLGVDGGGAAGAVVLGEARLDPLVRRTACARRLGPANDEPGDRSDEGEEEDQDDPDDLREV